MLVLTPAERNPHVIGRCAQAISAQVDLQLMARRLLDWIIRWQAEVLGGLNAQLEAEERRQAAWQLGSSLATVGASGGYSSYNACAS